VDWCKISREAKELEGWENMLSHSHSEIGEVIRKVRKDRGLKLEDLADQNISVATISNIERGVPHVKTDKVLYLLEKLNIELERIPAMIMGKQEELKALNVRLLGVESLFSNGRWEKAIEILDSLDLNDSHPLADYVFYLKGKCLMDAKKLKRAERSLYKAIQIASQKEDKTNIEAASFCELSRVCYLENDLDQAIKFTESGIDAFEKDGDRSYVWWTLHLNKALYLEKIGKLNDSLSVVLEVWDSIETMDETDTVLVFYWLRAELLRRMGQMKDCEIYALEGINIARRNGRFDQLFELWVVLGSAYVVDEKWDDAEFALDNALSLQGADERRYITAHAWMGRLYTSQQKWKQALSHLGKAISLGEKHNDVPQLVRALQYLGKYYWEVKDLDSAVHQYQKAAELSKKHNLKKQEYLALFRLAECWAGRDEKEFQLATVNMFDVQKRLASEEALPFDNV
jgi:tetratricopeptide (TPR) repeat protein